ncbi:DUF2637 domain-containing protein [Streptomyces sp. NPDC045369]|uniref:DUF2637 domain-containing protein n=1 Tax=Streptomyces sp. NPDC045369 TaxID=3155732 RepID=UPI0033F9184C
MTTIAEPRNVAPAAPVPDLDAPAPEAPTSAPGATGGAPDVAPATSTRREDRARTVVRVLGVLALLGAPILAGIGFAGSYSALVQFAAPRFDDWFVPIFPIGVDAGIVVLLVMDLYMIHRGTPMPVLRLLAHLFTLATIAFNASSGSAGISADPVGAGAHAIIPVAFIAVVEAARRLVMRMAQIAAGGVTDRVPFHRWLLAPWPTWQMYRRMRLWGVRSYRTAVELEKERTVYQVMLEREYGTNWRTKADPDKLLPLTMAQYGLSVAEALALPREAEERERLRQEAERQAELDAELRAEERQERAELARLRRRGALAETRADVEAQEAAAQARAAGTAAEAKAQAKGRAAAAELAASAAERKAAAEQAAEESAEAAALLRKAAEDEQRAAEARAAAAEAEKRAADKAAAAAEAALRVERAEAEKKAVVRRAAEDRQRAAEARAAAAEAEARAAAAEDLIKLTPSERTARRVARMILARRDHPGQDIKEAADALDLQTIQTALNVSRTVASDRRKDAVRLLQNGYDPSTNH